LLPQVGHPPCAALVAATQPLTISTAENQGKRISILLPSTARVLDLECASAEVARVGGNLIHEARGLATAAAVLLTSSADTHPEKHCLRSAAKQTRPLHFRKIPQAVLGKRSRRALPILALRPTRRCLAVLPFRHIGGWESVPDLRAVARMSPLRADGDRLRRTMDGVMLAV
jgi:hypothetical protein